MLYIRAFRLGRVVYLLVVLEEDGVIYKGLLVGESSVFISSVIYKGLLVGESSVFISSVSRRE